MKSRLLYAALGALALTTPATAQTNPTVYGSVVFGHEWEDMEAPPYGLYSMPADNGNAIKLEVRNDAIKANGGGVYIDGMYHLVDFTRYEFEQVVTFRTFDTKNNWKLINEQTIKSYSSAASDLTYDPVGDKIYGCFKETATSTQYFLGTLNPITGFASKIADIDEELIVLASTRDGMLYGVGAYGMLYSVDKQTGKLTKIGQTGKSVKYSQSATFDYASGRMLWAMTPHYTNESPELCEIDLSTGKTTTLATIPERYEFTGIYTLSPYAADNAPQTATAFGGKYEKGALSGTVSFTAPTATMGGSTLSGSLSYTLCVDDKAEQTATGTTTAGETVTLPKQLSRGMHYLKVATQNTAGRSPWAYSYFWAGTDEVEAKDAIAFEDKGAVQVTWEAPTKGVHDGYYDPTDVKYVVTRQPDNVKVYEGTATSCTDNTIGGLQYGFYYYEVVAMTGGYSGEAVKTDKLQLGTVASLPYEMLFDSETECNSLVIEDTNEDGYKWEPYFDCMTCGSSEAGLDDDDWVITPPFNLSTDSVYQVSIDAYGDQGYVKKLEIAAGKEQRGASLKQIIMPATQVAEEEYKTYTSEFMPEYSGLTYIGIHSCSPYDYTSYVTIDNLRITKIGSVHIPACATEATAQGVGAEKRVDIVFSAPTKDMKGGTLTENLTTVVVKNTTDDRLVKTFENVAPGTKLSVQDTPANTGTNEYAILATNKHGQGKTLLLTAYVGYDTPAAVTDINLSATDEGKVSLSWTAPNVGTNGGSIDQTSLKYNLGNLDGSSLRSTVVTSNAYSEQLTMKNDEQKLIWYLITPETATGKGETASTDTMFVGKPYVLPYKESFAKRSLERGPWYTYGSNLAKWDIMPYATYTDAEDGDHGLIAFSTITTGEKAHFVGPKISLKEANNPTLEFALYHMKYCTHRLDVQLQTPDGKLHTVGSFTPNDTEMENYQGEWKQMKIALSDYKKYPYVNLVFTGVGGSTDDLTTIVPLYVDNINIVDELDGNVALSEFTASESKVSVGDEIQFTATIENKGVSAADDYTVKLYRDGNCVDEAKGDRLNADTWAKVTLKDAPNADAKQTSVYTAEVVWDGDEDNSDNASKQIVVTVLPGKPYIDAAYAQKAEGGVRLSWNEPKGIADGTKAESVTEDFESYAPFTIEHFGEWTLFDGDKRYTIGIQDGSGDFIKYDNVEAEMAFQVFNPSAVSLNPLYFSAHSGKQVAAAFSVGRFTPNDDWLISPEVDGAQTITFWAFSPNASYYGTKEQIEVLYSTEDCDTASFKKIGATITVPGQWKQYTATLPAGTRHFAIRCVSQDQYILFLDDITYRKAARDFSLLGYNVYRGDELLTTAPIPATTYTDNAGTEDAVYSVSAVYNTGESRLTRAVWGDPTAITAPSLDENASPDAVYDIAGRRIATQNVGKGVFIVKKNGKAKKVLVK